MVILMKAQARQQDVDYLLRRASSLGLRTHVTEDDGRTVIGLLGDLRMIEPAVFAGLHGVERVIPTGHPFRLASLEYKSEPTVIHLDDLAIGGGAITIMAGPCSVESREQILLTAQKVRDAGGHMLRGGAFKPRTSPYSFQGMGEKGLELLAEARERTGLHIVTEVMATEQVALVSQYADMLQIGTRNMQNYALLYEVGKSLKPILLKRGMMSTVQELLMSAEYVLSCGNGDLILCERGIRTFETATRNTLDINAVPLLKEMTHLPVIVDPSHATGKASLVQAVSRAAVAAGADGLLIEVHPEPENALSDGDQSLDFQQFESLLVDIRRIASLLGGSSGSGNAGATR